jgi:membrane-bound metal-dependent hydrolase YbcI (DUF457 family)
MNPITHGLVGWCLAESLGMRERRERAIVTIAGIAPDIDGFGLPVELLTRNTSRPLLWWSEYHHVFGHNLLFTVLVAGVAAFVAKSRRRVTAIAAFVSVHLHLLGDFVGARGPDGYDWPIPYWYPFSRAAYSWEGQWALNAWPNIAITVVLLVVAFVVAWKRGHSPVELFSVWADHQFVATLRRRFARRA